MNTLKYSAYGVTSCWIVLKLLCFPTYLQHYERGVDCRQGNKMFCCKTFLFPSIAVLQKGYIFLLSPWSAAILMLWVNVRVGKDNLFAFLGKTKQSGYAYTRCSTLQFSHRQRFWFFHLNIFGFLEEKNWHCLQLLCIYLQHFPLWNFLFGEW